MMRIPVLHALGWYIGRMGRNANNRSASDSCSLQEHVAVCAEVPMSDSNLGILIINMGKSYGK